MSERELPIAYTVHQLHDGQWYPLRFGKFRLDSALRRISFGRREDAVAYCHQEQRDYELMYPSHSND